jgi:hypothetical protein
MSLRYPGGLITKSPTAPTSSAAKGIWTLEQALQYIKAGTWPLSALGDPYFQYNTMLLPGQGTNGAQNNTFLDSSTNNFTITRNGNTTQGTFTPFSGTAGNWSTFLNGSSSLSVNVSGISAGTSTFTLEFWVYLTAYPGADVPFVDTRSANGASTTAFQFGVYSTGKLKFYDGTETNLNGSVPLNQWTHIALVRDSGNTVTAYINGVSTGTTVSSTRNFSDNYFWIASVPAPASPYLNGYLSNLRWVVGSAVYTSAFTPPTSPLTAITNTKLLTLQSNRFVDNSANAYAITLNSTPQITPFQPFGAPTVAYSASTIGGSGYFDGSGDVLSIANTTALQFGTGEFTVEAWVYLTATPSAQYAQIIGRTEFGTNADWMFQVTNSRTLTWYMQGSYVATSTGTIPLNAWTQVAVTRSGSSIRLFINGTIDGTATNSGSTENTASGDYTIGADQAGDEANLTGYIASLRVTKGGALYTSNFTPSTAPLTTTVSSGTVSLLTNFTNAGIIDNAQDNNLETVGGAQISTTQFKWGASSMYFDGTGDQLIAPSNELLAFGTGDFTVEVWARFSSLSTYNTICATRPTTGATTDGWTFGVTSSGTIYMYTSSFVAQSGTGVISTSTWYHLALVRVGTTVKIFVNGNEVVTGTNSQNFTRKILYVGNNTTNDEPLTGYINDLRLTKGYARYPYSFTAPTAALSLFWQAAATPSSDPYFDYTTLLLPGNGTNGAQNNTFLDSSTNAFTITRNGNTTQGTFTPFSQTGWGNFFDGTGDYLTVASSADFNIFGGDMTVECWFYSTAASLGTRSEHLFAFVQDATNRESLYFNGTTLTFWTSSGAGSGPRITYANTPQNQWIHVAVTKSGSLFTMYINGVSVGTSTTTQYSTSNQSLQIGTYNSAGTAADNFTGYISNVRVVKGTPVYTTNFIPSTTPLTPVTNTVLLTCQSNRFIDTNTQVAAKTVTPSGDTSVQTFSPFNPTAAYSTSTVGGSGYFDGTSDYLSIADQTAFNLSTNDFTLEGWFYATGYPSFARPFGQSTEGAGGNNSIGFFFDTGGNGATMVMRWGTTANQTNDSGYITVNAGKNQWHHLVATRDGNTLRMYFDGVQVYSTSVAGLTFYNSTADFRIGASSNASPSEFWQGYLSGVRLVNGTCLYPNGTTFTLPTTPPTAVTNTALLANYTNGGIIDNTAKNNLETVGGASISTTQSKFGGSSMYFDGSGDWLTFRSNPHFAFGTGDFTIEAWVYPTSTAAGKNVCGTRGASGSTTAWNWGILTDSSIQMYSNGNIANTGANTVPINTWTHVAFVRYSGTIYGFVNGVLRASTANTQDFTVTDFWVGVTGGSVEPYLGYINDLRITKGIARYTQNFTPPTTAFLTL